MSPSIQTLCTPPVSPSVKCVMMVGCAASEMSRMVNPLRRFEAPSLVMMASIASALIFTSFCRRPSTLTESVITGFVGSVTSHACMVAADIVPV